MRKLLFQILLTSLSTISFILLSQLKAKTFAQVYCGNYGQCQWHADITNLQCSPGWTTDYGPTNLSPCNNLLGDPPVAAGICCDSPSGPTCSSAVNGYCSATYRCGTGYVVNGSRYACASICCRPEQCSDVGAYCTLSGHPCSSGFIDYNNGQLDSTCGTQSLCCVTEPTCTTGAVYGTCGGGSMPNNTCGYTNGSQSVTYTQTTPCVQSSSTKSCTQSYNLCASGYTCSNTNGYQAACVTTITAHVFTDYNHNGVQDNGELGTPNVAISDGGGNTFYTNSSGNITFTGKTTGNYTFTMTVPTNDKATTTNPVSFTLTTTNGNYTVNFGLTPLYTISGTIFSDTNKDQKMDNGETGYGGGTMSITNGPTPVGNIAVAANGTYTTPTTLESGTYTATYTTALPTGYTFTTPSSFVIAVGNPAGSPACATGGSLDAVCGGTNNGSISNLDIGVTNENAWTQSVCMDVRNDSGTYTNLIPQGPSCGGANGAYNSIVNGDCTSGAGILYTCNTTPDLGLGTANANNWQAGGAATNQQECFVNQGLNVIRTSYDYLLTTMQQSGITPIDMVTVCGTGGLANCTLPNNLAKGVYQANGDVYLNTYTFPVDPTTPQGFIFLINGNLYIQGNILVPRGSVAAFSAAQNISVDKSVGQVVNATTLANGSVNDPNIEGLYSADQSFIINSYSSSNAVCNTDGSPLDKKLNVIGSIITNAARLGGSFTDNRDLCIYDNQCASFSGGDGIPGTGNDGLGLSYILTLYADGKFLTHQVFNWQELNP